MMNSTSISPLGNRQSPVGNSTSTAAVDADNPWPGLAPFTEAQSAQFHGRDAEIKTLARRVQGDPLTVLFGQSGLGKSSLLQAGVFPRLRSADFCPIYIRLDHGPEAPAPIEQVKEMVRSETARSGQWTRSEVAKPGESLWEFFHHRDNRLVSPGGIALSPVLVFDQFEELFTLGEGGGTQRARAVTFITGLAELVENRPPEALVARLEESSAEMDAFDFSSADYRVIITLREDYLPHLESLKAIMPTLMDNRMRLSRMNGVQALDAVMKPGAGLVDETVARAIVEFVAGARGGSTERLAELDVEPPLLSVICRELNERRRALGQAQITADLVTGNRREILTDFYERSVADLPEPIRRFVEDKLLTKSGYRDNLALETALEEPGVTQPLIDTLVSRRLLRIEDRIGTQRVELTHDVLAEVIRASRDTRQQRLTLEKERQRERLTRRRMWLARTIAAGLLVLLSGVSWVAWRAVRAEREQEHLRAEETVLRRREAELRQQAQTRELAARRQAYASDMRALQVALDDNNLGRARQLLNRQRPQSGEGDLRGWEWRYLWQFCRNEAQSVLTQLPFSVTSIGSSYDGTWIAAGEWDDGGLTLWNRVTSEKIRVPAGGESVRVTFSPTEPLLAIGAFFPGATPATRVLLWSLESRNVVRELPMTTAIRGLVFSADGKNLLTCGNGLSSEVVVWRVADGAIVSRCPAPNPTDQDRWSFVAATSDLKLAAYGSQDGNLHLLDLTTGQRRWSTRGANERVMALKFSPDGKTLASGAGFEESAIRLWDVETGKERGRLEGHTRFVSQLEFSADGKTLYSASGDQTLRLWDVGGGRLLRILRGHETEVWAMALLPGDRTLVSGAKDGSLHIWDTSTPAVSPVAVISMRPSAWRFLGTGESVLLVNHDGKIIQRSGTGLQEETPIMEIDAVPTTLTYQPLFASDCALIAQGTPVSLGSPTAKIKIWDWERRTHVAEIATSFQQRITPLRFTLGGKSIVAINGVGPTLTLREWEVTSGKEIGSWLAPSSSSYRPVFTFSPDTKQVVALGYNDHHFHLDRASNRKAPLKADMKRQPANSGGAFSHGAKLFAAPSQYGWLRVLDMTQPNFPEIALLNAGVIAYHGATFSPDDQRLVTGSSGKTAVMLWDVNSFEPLLVLPGTGSVFRDPTFSPDGNSLGSTSGTAASGSLTVWRAPSWAEIEAAERNTTAKAGQ